jgi:hypothetical protein
MGIRGGLFRYGLCRGGSPRRCRGISTISVTTSSYPWPRLHLSSCSIEMITSTSRHRAMPIVTISTALRAISGEKQGSRQDAYHGADPMLHSPSDQGIEPQNIETTEALRLGEDNDCTNYTQIDPTHWHGHIDGRLGRRVASDV